MRAKLKNRKISELDGRRVYTIELVPDTYRVQCTWMSHTVTVRARTRVHTPYTHIQIFTCTHMRLSVRVTRLYLYVRLCVCVCVRACSRSLSDIGAIFPHVPRDKARQGEITRREQIHTYTRVGGREAGRDGWNARGEKSRTSE